MREAPTLIDHLLRVSYRVHKNEIVHGWNSSSRMREALVSSRRFVLDDGMSTFLGELASAAFQKTKGTPLSWRLVEQLRTSARLPHASTWIEYDLRLCQERSMTILGQEFDTNEMPGREGWLLQQHPKLEQAFIAHIFSYDQGRTDTSGFDTWTFPLAFAWTTDDSPLPWRCIEIQGRTASEVATGLTGYMSSSVGIVPQTDLITAPRGKGMPERLAELLTEWQGVMRRMWALLATINDIPVTFKNVVAAKGFVARGSYRRFLDHRVITLQVPQRTDLRRLARKAVAIARKRAHQVRGHWRKDRWHPGERFWIREHQRGDASLGFVTHDYKVTH